VGFRTGTKGTESFVRKSPKKIELKKCRGLKVEFENKRKRRRGKGEEGE